MTSTDAYAELVITLQEISQWGTITSILHWDERTCRPPAAAEFRSKQLGLLAKLLHEKFTSPRIGELLATVESSPLMQDAHGPTAVNVRHTRKSYDRATKLPQSLVVEMARVTSLAESAWEEAKAKSDFFNFAPWLEKVVALKQQEADCVSPGGNRYDTLLDEYEPDETSANVKVLFESLRGPLVELVGKIVDSGRVAPADILEREYAIDAQEKLAREAAAAIGFDFSAGVIARSVHPFCTTLGPADTRMTTRYRLNDFAGAFFGTLHETGHALYDQGLPDDSFGLPTGGAVSLGIHESQSRMWENLVGRSKAFWRFFLPKVRAAFPASLAGVSDDAWHFAINDVRPSFIRTESDETTYNLHVLLRFELESALIAGDLKVADLPGAWNEKMRKYLGLTPPDDAHGCLQDVHWSGGGIGYFPTYTLGNCYAAQFFEAARNELGDLNAMFAAGEYAPLLAWLRKNIHSQGQTYSSAELATRITGKTLSPDALLRHLRRNAETLYGVSA